MHTLVVSQNLIHRDWIGLDRHDLWFQTPSLYKEWEIENASLNSLNMKLIFTLTVKWYFHPLRAF